MRHASISHSTETTQAFEAESHPILERIPPVLDIEAVQRLVAPVHRTTIWRWVKEGRFPAPIRLGGGQRRAWRGPAIVAWLNSQEG